MTVLSSEVVLNGMDFALLGYGHGATWRRTYLDQHMVKGFIGVLDAHPTRRLPGEEGEQDRGDEAGRHYSHEIEGSLRQPTADAQVQSYVCTRPDDIGEVEANGVTRPRDLE